MGKIGTDNAIRNCGPPEPSELGAPVRLRPLSHAICDPSLSIEEHSERLAQRSGQFLRCIEAGFQSEGWANPLERSKTGQSCATSCGTLNVELARRCRKPAKLPEFPAGWLRSLPPTS